MSAASVRSLLLVLAASGLLLGAVSGQDLLGSLSPQQLQRLLFDKAYVRKQLDCVRDRAPCDQIGNRLKVVIPEVLTRQCRACSPQQAANARGVISYISANYPKEWSEIRAQYTG